MKKEKYLSKKRRLKLRRMIEDAYSNADYQKCATYLGYFLEEYPNDEYGRFFESRLLRQANLFEDALQILNDLDADKNFGIVIDKIKCFIELKRYEEALDLSSRYENKCNNKEMMDYCKRVRVFASTKLGIELNSSMYSYVEAQTICYTKDKTIDYIKHEMPKYCFKENISISDIEKIMDEIKEVLSKSKYYFNIATLTDTYLFEYPEIGEYENQTVNILKVVTTHDTNNIIMLYPNVEKKNLSYEKINENPKIELKVKQKRISQIDKFNARYQNFEKR